MASSMHERAQTQRPPRDKVGYVVGKYIEGGMVDGRFVPDFNGVERNIREALSHAMVLWKDGYRLFVPHCNTHHFEVKTHVPESVYQGFDLVVLKKLVDFIYATPNWRRSSGGRKEIMLACELGIPVFESLADVQAWTDGSGPYSTVRYNAVSEKERIVAPEVTVAMIDGPYWVGDERDPDREAITRNIRAAEDMAVGLWNAGLPCFTPQLNAGFFPSGYHMGHAMYEATNAAVVAKLADCLVLTEGWRGCPRARATAILAGLRDLPVFESVQDVLAWKDGRPYASVSLG